MGFVLRIIAITFFIFYVGCNSEPCDQAATKLSECLAKVNCNDTDPLTRQKCTTSKATGQNTLDELQSLPCIGPLKDTAEQYVRCSTDPSSFCECQ